MKFPQIRISVEATFNDISGQCLMITSKQKTIHQALGNSNETLMYTSKAVIRMPSQKNGFLV